MRALETFLGINPLGSEEPPQEVFYKRLIKVRNGEVDNDIKKTDIATYMTLVIFLKYITSSQNNLDQRASLNRANALVALAKLSSHTKERNRFYSEAYYLYTILSNRADQSDVTRAATKNAQKLLDAEKIRQRARAPLKMASMTEDPELMSIIRAEVNAQFVILEKAMGTFTGQFFDILQNQLRQNKEKLIQQTISDLMLKTPRAQEERRAVERVVQNILLQNEHLNEMTHLLGQLYLSVKDTPLLRGRRPVVVPVGRSVSWLVELHKALDSTLRTGIEFKHILASGLRTLEPTASQKSGYKSYLDGLGFNELEEENTELIFFDVSETGQTLISIKSFIEELYPGLKNHTQHFALLYTERTIDLPCARIGYMPDSLRPIMFSKHNEKQYYCRYPTFYPHDWETPGVIGEFVVPKGALEWGERMNIWTKGEGANTACRRIIELLEAPLS